MPALTISNLKKTYPNGFTALKGVDLTVPQGEFFALLGANGAGKSTMIGIISSLFPQTDGTVQIFGVDLHKNPSLAKSYLGIVPQEFNFNQFEKCSRIWEPFFKCVNNFGKIKQILEFQTLFGKKRH